MLAADPGDKTRTSRSNRLILLWIGGDRAFRFLCRVWRSLCPHGLEPHSIIGWGYSSETASGGAAGAGAGAAGGASTGAGGGSGAGLVSAGGSSAVGGSGGATGSTRASGSSERPTSGRCGRGGSGAGLGRLAGEVLVRSGARSLGVSASVRPS